MFDNLISGEEKQSPIDALLNLLDSNNRDSKTNVLMNHICVLVENRRLLLRKLYPDKSIIERDEMTLDYYKELKLSENGMSWEKVVEGIKEMKPQLMDINANEAMMKK